MANALDPKQIVLNDELLMSQLISKSFSLLEEQQPRKGRSQKKNCTGHASILVN